MVTIEAGCGLAIPPAKGGWRDDCAVVVVVDEEEFEKVGMLMNEERERVMPKGIPGGKENGGDDRTAMHGVYGHVCCYQCNTCYP